MLKVAPNQFIGSVELNKAFNGLKESGYQRLFKGFVKQFGVVLSEQDNLQVVNGTSGRWLTVKGGIAVDKHLNTIFVDSNKIDAIQFPNTIGTLFLCIKYKKSSVEKGEVTIQTDGTIVGSGTEFTKSLRGGLNQLKIRFPLSSSNLDDYPVLEVIDDTNAILNSVNALTAEDRQAYSVVGAFTPSVSIPEENKLIFQYDSYELMLTNSGIMSGEVFKLARVTWNGTSLSIEDVREQNKLMLFDTTAELVTSISQAIVSQYDLQVTAELGAQIIALQTAVGTLQQVDSDFNNQLIALSALLAQKANILQENWRYVANEMGFTSHFEDAFTGNNRTGFMKNQVGVVSIHCFLNNLILSEIGQVLFTLPTGYRPFSDIVFVANRWTGVGYPLPYYLQIATNGNVTVADNVDLAVSDKIQFSFMFQISQ